MSRCFFVVLSMFMVCEINANMGKYYFSDKTGYGRTFDGVGGLSAGASSKLLRGYPEKQRNEILDYLFKPNYGGALQILKVEIGGDAQSTDGTESTHMRTSDEENYERGYEWWLMLEAKKRNPDILLYGLPWGWPGWVGGASKNIYANPNKTAMYIVKWIAGAKSHYNLTIDYIGIWNEKMFSTNYIKTLRKSLDKNGFKSTRIIAADYFGWDLMSTDIMNDEELAAAIYAIGVHYPGTDSSMKALQTGKQLWSSEDYSTYDNLVGGGCWGRLLNQNYVNGFMSSTISWALIASWYQGLPYYGDGLMTAIEPWSGHYEVNSPIWLSAHTTQFTKVGWRYLQHGQGVGHLDGGGSYVALVSVNGEDLTIIVETMSHDHSVCIRPALPPFTVSPQNVTFVLNGTFAKIKTLNAWFSQLNFSGESVLFQQKAPIQVINNQITFLMGVDQLVTLTTVANGNKGKSVPSPSKPFPLPFGEDFEGYEENEEPSVMSQQVGSFEVHNIGGEHGKVMQQMTLQEPVSWCAADSLGMGMTIVGNPNWTDINVQVDFNINMKNGSTGVFIASRVTELGCQSDKATGVFFIILPSQQSYVLASSVAFLRHTLTKGKLEPLQDWNTVSLFVNGTSAVGSLNGKQVFNFIGLPATLKSGFVAMGTSSFGYAQFDNVKITSAQESFHEATT